MIPPACSPRGSHGSASIACRGARRYANGAIACCSCAVPKATSGRTSRTLRSRRSQPKGSPPRALAELSADELGETVHGLLPWSLRRRLEAEAPTHFAAPSGSSVPIDYEAEEGPKLAIRVQELFGLDRHPAIAGGRVPLLVELLSPAHRPVQVTRDLPGFWRGSYAAVKAEMKGRYPRHPWPDNPLAALATRRAKRRE
jgi:ATP-dependent helicase HrpB